MKYVVNYSKSFLYIIATILILSIITTLLNYFNILGSTIKYLKMIVPIVAMLIGGYTLGMNSSKKGYIEGLKIGLIFIVFSFLLTYLGFGNGVRLQNIIYYIILLVSSMLGSMIGINKKKA